MIRDFIRKGLLYVRAPESPEEPEEGAPDTKHTRRFFFGIMGGAAAAVVFAPTIALESLSDAYIRPATIALANSIDRNLNACMLRQEVTADTLKILLNNCRMIPLVAAEHERFFADHRKKIGNVISIQRPQRYAA